MSLEPGHRLGPYEVLAKLGEGGMGEVYRARDSRLGRPVALKTLPPQVAGDTTSRERFLREARTVSSLSHPNICPLFDIGDQGEMLYLVMECVEGETLASILKEHPEADDGKRNNHRFERPYRLGQRRSMGILSGLMGNASEVDATKLQDQFSQVLAPGERVEKPC